MSETDTGGGIWGIVRNRMFFVCQEFCTISVAYFWCGKSPDAYHCLWQNVSGNTGEAVWMLWGGESFDGGRDELAETTIAEGMVWMDLTNFMRHGLCHSDTCRMGSETERCICGGLFTGARAGGATAGSA